MIWPELHIDESSQYPALLKFYVDDDCDEEYMVQAVDSVEDGLSGLLSNIAMMIESYQSGFDDGYCNGIDDAFDDDETQLNK